MRSAVLTLAALGAAITTAPALAQPASDAADARCLLVLQAVSRDPKQKEAAARGVYYYMGKLTARGGMTRLDPVMLAEGKRLSTPQLAQAELTRCGNELTQNTQALQAANQRLQKAAQAAAAPAKK